MNYTEIMSTAILLSMGSVLTLFLFFFFLSKLRKNQPVPYRVNESTKNVDNKTLIDTKTKDIISEQLYYQYKMDKIRLREESEEEKRKIEEAELVRAKIKSSKRFEVLNTNTLFI